jgi:multidrug efflux pump subunit AcrA (membrane-fusion protein)
VKGPFVYVIHDDSTHEIRPVTLGQRHDDRIVVEQGLKPGERVVTAGQSGIRPDGKVKAEEPATGPPGSPKEAGN